MSTILKTQLPGSLHIHMDAYCIIKHYVEGSHNAHCTQLKSQGRT